MTICAGMQQRDDEETARTTGSALGKALAVLEAVAEDPRGASGAEITERSGLPKQTVHRVLRQLEDLGLLAWDAVVERYAFAARLRSLSRSVLAGSGAQNPAAHAVLLALVDALGETCNVGVLDDDQVIYLDRAECHWPLRLQLHAGSRVPVHCTAIGKLLLAHLPREQLERLLRGLTLARHTRNTLVTRATLLRALDEVRVQGHAVNQEEDFLGLGALAVPVRDAQGQVVAGLAVHAPLARFPLRRMLAERGRLEKAAAAIGRELFPGNERRDRER